MDLDTAIKQFDAYLPEGKQVREMERRHMQEVLDGIGLYGGMFQMNEHGEQKLDRNGKAIPADYVVVRGRRFLVDKHGVVYRFAAHGTPKMPDDPRGGGIRRNNAIEMWTGKWRTCFSPDGKPTYAKRTCWVPVDRGINGHPHISVIDWYRAEKGYRNLFDPPHGPSQREIRQMDRRREATSAVVYAKMAEMAAVDQPNFDVEAARAADPVERARQAVKPKPGPKRRPKARRTNRRKPAAAIEPAAEPQAAPAAMPAAAGGSGAA